MEKGHGTWPQRLNWSLEGRSYRHHPTHLPCTRPAAIAASCSTGATLVHPLGLGQGRGKTQLWDPSMPWWEVGV